MKPVKSLWSGQLLHCRGWTLLMCDVPPLETMLISWVDLLGAALIWYCSAALVRLCLGLSENPTSNLAAFHIVKSSCWSRQRVCWWWRRSIEQTARNFSLCLSAVTRDAKRVDWCSSSRVCSPSPSSARSPPPSSTSFLSMSSSSELDPVHLIAHLSLQFEI